MRVRSHIDIRPLDIQTVMRLSETVRIDTLVDEEDNGYTEAMSLYLSSPELPEEPDEVVNTNAFHQLTPGWESTVIVLRSDGYSLPTISKITGLPKVQIMAYVFQAQEKLKQFVRPQIR